MDPCATYHYRGQKPSVLGDCKFTKLARFFENESSLTLAEKYCDLSVIKDEISNGKRQPVLHCLVWVFFSRLFHNIMVDLS